MRLLQDANGLVMCFTGGKPFGHYRETASVMPPPELNNYFGGAESDDEMFGGSDSEDNAIFGGGADNEIFDAEGGASDIYGSGLIDEIKKIEKQFGEKTECSFAQDASKGDLCSPPEIQEKIQEVAAIVESDSKKVATPEAALEVLKKKFDCDTESCVLKGLVHRDYAKYINSSDVEEALTRYFKPRGPADNFGLLSNFNIDGVLDQYAQKYKNFLHIPFQMRDFEKNQTDLSVKNFNISETFSKYETFGCVLNTDLSTGRGIHWFCIFGDARDKKNITLEYFNSSGKPPLPEVAEWMQKQHHLFEQANPNKKLSVVRVADSALQDDDHSCGVWCLAYIWLRLRDVPIKWFTPRNVNDSIMHKLRSFIFIAE